MAFSVKADYLGNLRERPNHPVADRKLWLNAARNKIVEDGSPEAAFLLCGKGKEIPAEYAALFKRPAKRDEG